jgi:glycosyltransferase involved in cell wall biosynthesis
MENGISVIMISYLSDYQNSRKYPKEKFIRAVNSFLNQTHEKKELIIVSDGCEITNQLYFEHFDKHNNIYLIRAPKQKSNWPGKLRECARTLANYEWITYLDSDDMFIQNHLFLINDKINSLNEEMEVILNYKKILPLIKDGHDDYYNVIGVNKEEVKRMTNKWFFTKVKSFTGTWQVVHKNSMKIKCK